MRLKFSEGIANFTANLEKTALERQFGYPPKHGDSPVTQKKFYEFITELKKGFNDLAKDLETIRRELEK